MQERLHGVLVALASQQSVSPEELRYSCEQLLRKRRSAQLEMLVIEILSQPTVTRQNTVVRQSIKHFKTIYQEEVLKILGAAKGLRSPKKMSEKESPVTTTESPTDSNSSEES